MKTRRLLCGALTALPLLPLAPSAASTRSARAVTHADRADAASSAAYWTDARMATATPLDGRTAAMTARLTSRPAMPTARVGGSKVVGALFFDNGNGRHYCTASVVDTPKRNLLLTAAHCLYNPYTRAWNRRIVFVPKYGQGHRPYGTWPVWLMVVDQRWMNDGQPDVDVGFAAVQVIGGRRIADIVGGNRLMIGRGHVNRVTVIGYPAKTNFPSDRPIECSNVTRRQADRQMRFDCRGFYGGTSGSPWIARYDDRTESGYVIGAIGGHQKGGEYDWRSYSPVFDGKVGDLIVTANDQA